MAKARGVSPATVQRIWAARGIQPHRVETFKLSNDPKFEDKLVDVVGLYLNPPEKAIVLCMDEKSQIQALDRTPAEPADEARVGRHDDPRLQAQRDHDSVRRAGRPDRHGDRSMPPAPPPHRVLQFLMTIDRAVPKGLDDPSDPRQLRDPQPPQGQGVAREAPPLSPALHADLVELAEPRRALLRQAHRQGDPPRRSSTRSRT